MPQPYPVTSDDLDLLIDGDRAAADAAVRDFTCMIQRELDAG